MSNTAQIRQAAPKDISRIASFLHSSPFIHRHLDWRNTFEWLDGSPFLMLLKEDEIQAILVAVPDPPGFAWIHCFAVGKSLSPSIAWEILSEQAKITLNAQKAAMVGVGLQDWFSNVLLHHDFTLRQKIVVLEWNHHLPAPASMPEGITFRPMEQADLIEVSEVDRLSFEPLWVNTLPALEAAFLQSDHAAVAECQGKIVGYELSTSAQYTAHLARLAVLPEFRSQKIGKTLVTQMLAFFSGRGILQLTVNTQSDNHTSLQLYTSIGFHPTFEEFPVYIKER